MSQLCGQHSVAPSWGSGLFPCRGGRMDGCSSPNPGGCVSALTSCRCFGYRSSVLGKAQIAASAHPTASPAACGSGTSPPNSQTKQISGGFSPARGNTSCIASCCSLALLQLQGPPVPWLTGTCGLVVTRASVPQGFG